jgi:hypothetical protein
VSVILIGGATPLGVRTSDKYARLHNFSASETHTRSTIMGIA